MNYTYTITRSGALVTFDDGTSRTVPSENAKQFELVLEGIKKGVSAEEMRKLVDGREYVKYWACGVFVIRDDKMTWIERPNFEIPECLQKELREFALNNWPAESFANFMRLLLQNPSKRSIETFYQFIQNQGLTIDADGYVVGYKSIRNDWTDWHTGTIDNRPGCQPVMDRSKVDDDPTQECSVGFHFGGRQYVMSFGGCDKRIVAVRVNPKDLVCVPHDCQYGKVRVCTYKVLREIPQEGEFKSYWNAGLVGESEGPACEGCLFADVAAGRECPSCGTFYGEGDKYCKICGAQLPEAKDDDDDDDDDDGEQADTCPNCGTDRVFDEHGAGAAFCTGCGYRYED